jgi:hypothetical protein
LSSRFYSLCSWLCSLFSLALEQFWNIRLQISLHSISFVRFSFRFSLLLKSSMLLWLLLVANWRISKILLTFCGGNLDLWFNYIRLFVLILFCYNTTSC